MCYLLNADCEKTCNSQLRGSCVRSADTNLFCCEYQSNHDWWWFPTIFGASVVVCCTVLIILHVLRPSQQNIK